MILSLVYHLDLGVGITPSSPIRANKLVFRSPFNLELEQFTSLLGNFFGDGKADRWSEHKLARPFELA